jgi:MFS family permease
MVRPGQMVSTLAAAGRNENVRRVELSWGAAIAAEWAHFVALGVFAYNHGGTGAVGVAGLVRLLPAALIAPFAASLGDRFRRERVLLAMTLLGAAALAASAVAYFADSRLLVFAFAAVLGVATTLIRPALQALLPSLARTPEELIAANGATSTIESLGTLVGPLLAGVLVATTNAGVVFAGAAGTMVVAAALLAMVRVEGRVELEDEAGARQMVVEGLRSIWRAADARLLIALVAAQTFVRGCLNVLIVVAAFQVLHSGAGAVGYMTAAIGVGGLVGAVGAMTLEGRPLAVPFGAALVFWGIPLLLIAPRPQVVAAIALLAVVGAANSVEDVAVFTLIQRIIPDELLSRVLGVLWGLAMGAVALGSIAAPLVVHWLGARTAFAVVGGVLPLLVLVTYRRLAAIDDATVPAPELELIDLVPMFVPLSVAGKERIASKLQPHPVRAGEIVIRAGEEGDGFYLVESGELDIDAGGRHTTAQRGDYFGEIALLRDVPRTATVTATADSRLLELQRNDFLAAVTGHSVAHAAGHAVAESRLSQDADATKPLISGQYVSGTSIHGKWPAPASTSSRASGTAPAISRAAAGPEVGSSSPAQTSVGDSMAPSWSRTSKACINRRPGALSAALTTVRCRSSTGTQGPKSLQTGAHSSGVTDSLSPP